MISFTILRQRWRRQAVEGIAGSSAFSPHVLCKILTHNTHLPWEGIASIRSIKSRELFSQMSVCLSYFAHSGHTACARAERPRIDYLVATWLHPFIIRSKQHILRSKAFLFALRRKIRSKKGFFLAKKYFSFFQKVCCCL